MWFVRVWSQDGDEFGAAIRLRCRIVEGGLTLMVPKGHDTSRI